MFWNVAELDLLLGAMESLATVLALVVGGLWTYRLFVKNRVGKPRAEIAHAVTIKELMEDHVLVHVALRVRNTSQVLMRLVEGRVDLQTMLPVRPALADKLRAGVDATVPGWYEIEWQAREQRHVRMFDWKVEPRELEPQEGDTFHVDFVVPRPVTTVRIYSFLRNETKRRRPIGWTATTIHDVPATRG